MAPNEDHVIKLSKNLIKFENEWNLPESSLDYIASILVS